VVVALDCATSGNTIQVNKNGTGDTPYVGPVTIGLDEDEMYFHAEASGYANSPTDYYSNPSSGGA
jgi:hypothetical protein